MYINFLILSENKVVFIDLITFVSGIFIPLTEFPYSENIDRLSEPVYILLGSVLRFSFEDVFLFLGGG